MLSMSAVLCSTSLFQEQYGRSGFRLGQAGLMAKGTERWQNRSGFSELLRTAITCVHISTAKASHGQANAKYSPSTGTGQMNILAITQSITVYKSITSNCQCPSLRILLRKTVVEHAKAG